MMSRYFLPYLLVVSFFFDKIASPKGVDPRTEPVSLMLSVEGDLMTIFDNKQERDTDTCSTRENLENKTE